MKTSIFVVLSFLALAALPVRAQAPVVGVADAEALFKSPDPKLNANKQVVYAIFRDLLEANHWELADKYLTERYIQHNPNAASGRAGVITFFTQVMKVQAQADREDAEKQDRLGDRRRGHRHRRLAARIQGSEGPVKDVYDHLVRHVANQGRQSRRALGFGDEESVDSRAACYS